MHILQFMLQIIFESSHTLVRCKCTLLEVEFFPREAEMKSKGILSPSVCITKNYYFISERFV